MKIAIVSTVNGSPWAGSEELWYQTALKCLEVGYEVTASVFQVNARCVQHQNFKSKGGEIIYRKPFWNGRLHVFTHKYISSFNNLFKDDPDVLILSLGCMTDLGMYPDLVRYLTKNKKIKVVTICLYNSDNIIPDPFTRERIRFFCNRSDESIFVSKHNYLLTERQNAIKIKNAHVFSSPVSYQDSHELLPWPEVDGLIQMASVARLDVRTKGQDVLLETLSTDKWKSRNWHLNIYGKGEDFKYISQLIGFYQLSDKVSFGGFVADTRDIWKKNHMLVMPSRSEGLSLAFLEAMICGRICVATDVGGFAEVITDSESGFLAEAPLAKYFDAALERAWQNQENYSSIRIKANAAAARVFEVNPIEQMLQFINNFSIK